MRVFVSPFKYMLASTLIKQGPFLLKSFPNYSLPLTCQKIVKFLVHKNSLMYSTVHYKSLKIFKRPLTTCSLKWPSSSFKIQLLQGNCSLHCCCCCYYYYYYYYYYWHYFIVYLSSLVCVCLKHILIFWLMFCIIYNNYMLYFVYILHLCRWPLAPVLLVCVWPFASWIGSCLYSVYIVLSGVCLLQFVKYWIMGLDVCIVHVYLFFASFVYMVPF
jgi:hypothetical protein